MVILPSKGEGNQNTISIMTCHNAAPPKGNTALYVK